MIVLPEILAEDLRAHACETYPDECCGLLIGKKGENVQVCRIQRTKNLNKLRAHDRYELDPAEHLAADRLARDLGETIVGFYHTHPDKPARPSQEDLACAFPIYSYVILSVKAGKPTDMTSWVLDEDGAGFAPQEIQLSN